MFFIISITGCWGSCQQQLHNVLTKEMESIHVEFKFYEEHNKLAETTNRNKVDKSKGYLNKLLNNYVYMCLHSYHGCIITVSIYH